MDREGRQRHHIHTSKHTHKHNGEALDVKTRKQTHKVDKREFLDTIHIEAQERDTKDFGWWRTGHLDGEAGMAIGHAKGIYCHEMNAGNKGHYRRKRYTRRSGLMQTNMDGCGDIREGRALEVARAGSASHRHL